jgi:hypothetical protein
LTISDEKLGAYEMVKSKNFHMNIIVISLVISKGTIILEVLFQLQAFFFQLLFTHRPNFLAYFEFSFTSYNMAWLFEVSFLFGVDDIDRT